MTIQTTIIKVEPGQTYRVTPHCQLPAGYHFEDLDVPWRRSIVRVSDNMPVALASIVYPQVACSAPRCFELTTSPAGLCPEHEDGAA
jgi:hypothetical protein